ncbi:MAG: hypothetical protein AAGG69_10640, partial [Pseudomonadota bacterium]
SKQYGMVMALLAVVYAIMLFDPIRYLNLIWVAVAEQGLGIAYGFYIYAMLGQLTFTQLMLQASVNAALIIAMLFLWSGLKSTPTAKAA